MAYPESAVEDPSDKICVGIWRETVEHPFGTIKQWMNQGAVLMRGLEKVRAEFRLTALAYNLRRVLNIVGLPKLIAVLQA
jgi:transposase